MWLVMWKENNLLILDVYVKNDIFFGVDLKIIKLKMGF